MSCNIGDGSTKENQSNTPFLNTGTSVEPATDTKHIITQFIKSIEWELIWEAGILICGLWFIITSLIFGSRLRHSRTEFQPYKKRNVYISDKIVSPCVFGLFPDIYITPYAAKSPNLELILRHEDTHIRHGDHIWSALRIVFVCIFWWNPLIWAAAALSKQDGELACDEAVYARMDRETQVIYAKMLFDTASECRRYSLGLGAGHIKERLLMIGKKKNIFAAFLATAVSLSFLSAAFITPVYANRGIYDSLPQIMSEDNVVNVIADHSFYEDGFLCYSVWFMNGENKVKFGVSVPLDYEEKQYPVVLGCLSKYTSEHCVNISGDDAIGVLYDPGGYGNDGERNAAEGNVSDMITIINLLLKCKFVDESHIILLGSSNDATLAFMKAKQIIDK